MKKILLIVLSLYAAAQAKSFEEVFKETEPMADEIRGNAQQLENPTLTLEEKVALCVRIHILQQNMADLFRDHLQETQQKSDAVKQNSDNTINSSLTPEEQAAMAKRLDLLEARLQTLESRQVELKTKAGT